MAPSLVVLAAGMGSRYGGLKQIDPVGPAGEFIIDYSVYDAVRAGFGKVIFVIRRELRDAFQAALGSRYDRVVKVEYAFQELTDLPDGFSVPAERSKPWGTGQAVLAARELITEPFAVINADDFYGREGFSLLADYLSRPEWDNDLDCCMAGFVLRNTLSPHGGVSRGICTTDDDGFLQSVIEAIGVEPDGSGANYPGADGKKVSLTGDEPVSMNMWGFPPGFITYIQTEFTHFLAQASAELKAEFYLPLPVSKMIEAGLGRCQVLTTEASWFGVTYPADKVAVQKSLRELTAHGEYPERLFD